MEVDDADAIADAEAEAEAEPSQRVIPVLLRVSVDLASKGTRSRKTATHETPSSSVAKDFERRADNAEDTIEQITNNPNSSSVHRLPEEMLIHVFSFLPRTDLLRASSTSREWRRLIFNAGRLWRVGNLNITCYSHPGGTKYNLQTSKFCKEMGHFLRRLKITCLHPDTHACRFIGINFRRLIRSLRFPSLTSFRVLGLGMHKASPQVASHAALLLSNLLRTQRQLRTFHMNGAQWSRNSGQAVFSALVSGSASTLTDLKATQFFSPFHSPRDSGLFQKGLQSLGSLTRLDIDYDYLTDDTVRALAKSRKNRLSRLSLYVENPWRGTRIIHTHSWKALRNACPSLRIALDIRISILLPTHTVRDIMDSRMRIHSFTFHLKARALHHPLRVSIVLHHLTKHFRRRLTCVDLDIATYHYAMDAEVERLVDRCTNLQRLKVVANFCDKNIRRKLKELMQDKERR